MPTKIFPDPPSFAPAAPGGVRVDAGAWSRKGVARAVNEDHYASASLSVAVRGAAAPLLLVVADGLGGEAAGQRASRVATKSMVDSLESLPSRRLAAAPEDALKEALVRAHLDVLGD